MNYRPLPNELTIKESKIDGLGIFTTQKLKKDTYLGITHIQTNQSGKPEFTNAQVRTPLGGFINHSKNPNSKLITNGNNTELYTVKDILISEEITVKYNWYNPIDNNL